MGVNQKNKNQMNWITNVHLAMIWEILSLFSVIIMELWIVIINENNQVPYDGAN